MATTDQPDSNPANKAATPETGAASPAPKLASPPKPRSRKRFVLFTILVLIILAFAGPYYFRTDFPYCWTDDAYVHGNQIFLTPRVTGTVVSINADDTDLVQKGQPLVVLDDSDAKVQLLLAEAALGDTMRKVCQYFANVAEAKANVEARKVDLAKAKDDSYRRTTAQSGSVSSEDITHAKQAEDVASAVLNVAQQELGAAKALTDNTDLEHHPAVLQAEAHVLDADLALQRTAVDAPETGYVVQRNVEVGERVTPGSAMLAIVPLNQIWVDANFKEALLRNVRIGQPVTLKSDFYGDSVEYKGHVVGLDPSTGAALSLLPPDEGSGNWIKIIQRVPVRVILDDDKDLEKFPLRIGLSMRVTIDTHDRGGDVLIQTNSEQPVYATEIYSNEWVVANELVQSLVATNLEALAKLIPDSSPAKVQGDAQMEMTHE